MDALDKIYCFYVENEDKLLKQFGGKYLVIANDMTVHPFEKKMDAYYYGEENYGLGNFMLQLCDYENFHTVHTVNMKLAN